MTYKHRKRYVILKKYIIETIMIIIGALFIAIGTAFFLLPNQLSSGGFSGITTIIYYLIGFPMGTTMIIINLPLFIIALLKIGKRFFFKALVGTAVLSIFLNAFEGVSAITHDRLLASIYGGILIGIGTAIILKVGSSTGGTDLVATVIKGYNPYISMSRYLIIMDIIIISLNVLFFKHIEIGLYSIIAIYLYGQMIDIIFEGVYYTKLLFIISDKNEEISKVIGENVKRGVTGLYGKGMYKNEDKLVLICAASRNDTAKIKDIAKKVDEHCFIVIGNVREVLGKGFKET